MCAIHQGAHGTAVLMVERWLKDGDQLNFQLQKFRSAMICRKDPHGLMILLEFLHEFAAATWQDLNQWGGFQRDHKKIEGLVKIKPLGSPWSMFHLKS